MDNFYHTRGELQMVVERLARQQLIGLLKNGSLAPKTQNMRTGAVFQQIEKNCII